MRRAASLVAAAAFVALGGCGGSDQPDAASVSVDGVTISDAWTRPTPPGVEQAAIYLTLELDDGPADEAIAFGSARCASIVPHRTVITDDDVASMPSIIGDELSLQHPGDTVVLAPLGLHLMCLGLSRELTVGDRFDVMIDLRERGRVDVPVSVEDR